MIFEPDIFSKKTPIWNRITGKEINIFKDLCKQIPKLYVLDIAEVYYSGAFEINSNNYRWKKKLLCLKIKNIFTKNLSKI